MFGGKVIRLNHCYPPGLAKQCAFSKHPPLSAISSLLRAEAPQRNAANKVSIDAKDFEEAVTRAVPSEVGTTFSLDVF